MARELLWRGMLAGLIAAFLAGLFALAFAEPQIDGAIAVEAAHAAHDGMGGHEEELVSRGTQKTAGLFTAMAFYGAAVGGIFSLVFAAIYGRVGPLGPRSLALLLALAAFVVVTLVPALKYPPTPPAVGQHETVAMRTAAFFAMIGVSLLAAIAGAWVRRRLLARFDGFDALLGGVIGYVLLVVVAQALLPAVDEVPADFPATLLWRFRLASLGSQLLLWSALGLVFGRLADASLRTRGRRRS